MTLRPSTSLAVFAGAIFTSALLLFMVQPMVAKLLLPQMGGAAQVWTLCMVFFQAVLLLGYIYAWALQRWISVKRQLLVHSLVAASALVFLPISLRAIPGVSAATQPSLWLLGALTLTVGLPFFVTSTTSPLLQAWFSHTDHPQADDPYHLYAASNVGSMLALLGYSLVLEPLFSLGGVAWIWAGGYALFLALLAYICSQMLSVGQTMELAQAAGHKKQVGEPPSWKTRGLWVLYGAIPSSMLVGATHHLTTDIASVPLLWIGPLAIYLLSFIIAFARRQPIPRHVWSILAFTTAPLLIAISVDIGAVSLHVPVCLIGLLIVSVAYHGAMVERRPETAYLTSFYVLMSLGGVLGGMFNGLLAPVIFDGFYEYLLICVLAAVALPPSHLAKIREYEAPRQAILALIAALSELSALIIIMEVSTIASEGAIGIITAVTFVVLLGVLCVRTPLLAYIVFICMGGGLYVMKDMRGESMLFRERSFYGVVTVGQVDGVHVLSHGTTVHGAQRFEPSLSLRPLTYHSPTGPAGEVFTEYLRADATVGIVGLGAGALCGFWREGDHYELYDIDPLVVEVAKNTELFTYLDSCGGPEIITRDGRLALEERPEHHYDLIVIDAFNSDSIPTHLLTREAMEIYQRSLKPDGMLLLHISNRHLDLRGVVKRLAEHVGMRAFVKEDFVEAKEGRSIYEKSSSRWGLLTADESMIGALHEDPTWDGSPPDAGAPLWTDSYTSMLQVIAPGSMEPKDAAEETDE